MLRWSWRVGFYSYSALGTDRYPPFTPADLPDYPATRQMDYPMQLSRGLALVKWWPLAIPHYLVVGFFVGAGYVVGQRRDLTISTPGGLIALLVLFAGLAVLFVARYPRGIFRLRPRYEPQGPAGRRLRRPDDRRVSAIPARPRRRPPARPARRPRRSPARP